MIFISAGHHPAARGARFHDFIEYDEATAWAGLVLQLLKENGAECAYVPTGQLNQKIGFINSHYPRGELAVEIHFNSDPGRAGKGSETLYYPSSANGKAAAEIMQRHVSQVFWPDRGAAKGYYLRDPKRGPDFFLSSTSCTALIVEAEFLHNKDTIITNRQAGASAIVGGILEIVSEQAKAA